MRWLIAAVALLVAPAAASAVPTISDPVLSPTAWSTSASAGVVWIQSDFSQSPLLGAAVEVNAATDGSASGAWLVRATLPGPLADGANGVINLPVGALEGRHRVRIRVDGAAGSPLDAGVLKLDRTAPFAHGLTSTPGPDPGTTVLAFTLDDAGAGVSPSAPVTVEVFDGATWRAPLDPVAVGGGPVTATFDTGGMADGAHPVRIGAEDAIGNAATADHPGGLVVDETPPDVETPEILRVPTAGNPEAELRYTAVDAGAGLDPAVPARVVDADTGTVYGEAANLATQQIVAVLPGPGTYGLAVRVTDRTGRTGTSAPVVVQVPAPAPGGGDGDVLQPVQIGAVAPAGRWAVGQVRRFHARRGVRMTGRLITARTAVQWRATLRRTDAARWDAYSTPAGTVALGPRVVGGLSVIANRRRCRAAACTLTRRDADRAVDALAVTLHESLHVTGPRIGLDELRTPHGRAFEEGFTEAAALDLLPVLIADLDVPATIRRRLAAVARAHRPRYAAQVAWARRQSRVATGRAVAHPAARRWRIRVADTWGADRWTRLAAATRTTATALQASAPPAPG